MVFFVTLLLYSNSPKPWMTAHTAPSAEFHGNFGRFESHLPIRYHDTVHKVHIPGLLEDFWGTDLGHLKRSMQWHGRNPSIQCSSTQLQQPPSSTQATTINTNNLGTNIHQKYIAPPPTSPPPEIPITKKAAPCRCFQTQVVPPRSPEVRGSTHQLQVGRLVGYPMIYGGFIHPKWWKMLKNHQQYGKTTKSIPLLDLFLRSISGG